MAVRPCGFNSRSGYNSNKRAAPPGGFFIPQKTEHKAKRLRKWKINLLSLLVEIGRSTVEEWRQSLQSYVLVNKNHCRIGALLYSLIKPTFQDSPSRTKWVRRSFPLRVHNGRPHVQAHLILLVPNKIKRAFSSPLPPNKIIWTNYCNYYKILYIWTIFV